MAKTKVELEISNQSSFPNNVDGLITPQILRDFNTDLITSLVDEVSYTTSSAALNAFTASADGRLDNIEATTASLNTSVNSLTTSVTNINAFTSSANAELISQQAQINALTLSGSGVVVSENGIPIGTAVEINFTGSMSASYFGGIATIDIIGGSGGSTDTGSLLVTASASGDTITFTKGDASTFDVQLNIVDAVTSVNGLSGSVVLSTADISSSLNRRYVTDDQLISLNFNQLATIYVSKAGSDDNAGTSEMDPKLTLSSAIIAADGLIAGGQTGVLVSVQDGGTYTEAAQLTVNANVHVLAPAATFVGSVAVNGLGSFTIDKHFASANNQTMAQHGGGSGAAIYNANISDGRGVNANLTGVANIRNTGGGGRNKFAKVNVLFVTTDGIGVGDVSSGNAGHIHIYLPDLYLAGNNAIGILGSASGAGSSNIVGFIDHILEINAPTNTFGIVMNAADAVVKLTASEIVADTAYSITNGSLYLSCPKITGAVSGTPTNLMLGTVNIGQSAGTIAAGDDNRFTALNSYTASANIRFTNIENTTASLNTSVSNLNTFTSSVNLTSLNAYTASANIRFTNIEAATASLNTSVSNLNTFTSSVNLTSLNSYTASANIRFTNIEATTSSLNTSVTNINAFTASQTNLNGTFATTGSNSFVGNQTITGTLTASLEEGHAWVGNGSGITTAVPTSSFAGSGAGFPFTGDAVITGSLTVRGDINVTSSSLSGSVITNLTDTFTDVAEIDYIVTLTSASYAAIVSGSTANGNTLYVVTDDDAYITTTAFNSFTSSANGRLDNLESATASVNTSITNLNTFTSSQATLNGGFATTASLNTYTASADGRLNNLESTTASLNTSVTNLNTYTASADIRFTNIESATASLNTSVSNINAYTASQISLNGGFATTASLNNYTASADGRLNNLESATASLNTSVSNINTTTASLLTSIAEINTFTASVNLTSLNSFTASADIRLTNIESATASLNTSVANLNTYTSSQNVLNNGFATTASLNTYTASVDGRITQLEASTASLNTSVANLNTYTSSTDGRLTNIEAVTASLNTSVANLNTFTASQTNLNSTFATTGSNSFNGNQIITGSITASLQEGYVWVGNSAGITTTVPTSSFVGTPTDTASLVTTSSFNSYTASVDVRLTNIESATASLDTSVTNLNSFTSSQNVLNAGFATTGSNTFNGNQIITGSITVTGSAYGNVNVLSVTSQTASMDMGSANFFVLTLPTGSTTHLDATNVGLGQTVSLLVKQESTGTGSLVFAPEFKFPTGSTYVASATGSAQDIITFVTFNTTSEVFGTSVKQLV